MAEKPTFGIAPPPDLIAEAIAKNYARGGKKTKLLRIISRLHKERLSARWDLNSTQRETLMDSKEHPMQTLLNATQFLLTIADDLANATKDTETQRKAQELRLELAKAANALAKTKVQAEDQATLLRLVTSTLAALLNSTPYADQKLILPEGHTQRERATLLLQMLEKSAP
jgi:hypothetical protein